VSAQGAACTTAQLSSPDNRLFRLTGVTGSPKLTGTGQVVSYDRPTGNKVSAITRVRLVGPGSALLSSTPVTFTASQPDVGGGINVVIPTTVAAGTYHYELTLRITRDGTCTLNSVDFPVQVQNSQLCTPDSSTCLSQTSYAECGANGAFGNAIACGAGTTCTQFGSEAICSAGTSSVCSVFGQTRCSGDTGFQYCEFSNDGSGLIWKSIVSCAPGTNCQATGSGFGTSCVVPVTLSCTSGAQRCAASGNGIETCTNNVWTQTTTCTGGQSCSSTSTGPVCSLQTGGTCNPGSSRCFGADRYQQCIQSATGSWALGDPRNCPPSTSCNVYLNDYTICA
jgi:hypothetical protein